MQKLLGILACCTALGGVHAAEPSTALSTARTTAPTTAPTTVSKTVPTANPKTLAKAKPVKAKAAKTNPPMTKAVVAAPVVALSAPAALSVSPTPAAPTTLSPVSTMANAPARDWGAGEIHTGYMVCELGNAVTVTPDPQQASRFIVQMKKHTFHMTPVKTTTGALRLEDTQAGTTWLQLPHKSMLLNSKLGQRMADECQSDHQIKVAHRLKQEPMAGLLDRPTFAKQ